MSLSTISGTGRGAAGLHQQRCGLAKRQTPASRTPMGRKLMVCKGHEDREAYVQGSASSRRDFLASGAMLMLGSCAVPPQIALAEEAAFKTLNDKTLAYAFKFPVETASGKKLNLTFSRKPEKYSSAAPLSADARQRIVAETLDLINAVTVSVTVGPASGVLKKKATEDWTAEQVAETILVDRSTARVTTGQRVALNSVEFAQKEERDGLPYYVFEHVSQAAPNLSSGRMESFRHALAVSSYRPGLDGTPYLYTLNLACPDENWDDLEPVFQEAIRSFRLTDTTNSYVPPDKDPWLFF